MNPEQPEKQVKIDEIEQRPPVSVREAADEIIDFLFNPLGELPFGAQRFSLEELKDQYFAQEKAYSALPLVPSDFPGAVRFLCEQGLLGYDQESDTYYDKASA